MRRLPVVDPIQTSTVQFTASLEAVMTISTLREDALEHLQVRSDATGAHSCQPEPGLQSETAAARLQHVWKEFTKQGPNVFAAVRKQNVTPVTVQYVVPRFLGSPVYHNAVGFAKQR